MDVMSRGKCDHGLTWMPRLRRSWLMLSLSTMRNSRPNLSRICSCHCTWREDGQTISTERTRWRMISSRTTRPASMVLPRPTSSAISRLTRGIDGPHHRVELVVVDVDAAAKRGLQGFVVGLGDSPPANGVEKGLQALGIVERVRVRKGEFLVNGGPGFQLPDDLKLFAQAVVFDRGELDQVVWLGCLPRQAGS